MEAGVEGALGGNGDGLIRRQGADGEKSRRVAGEAGEGDHADPFRGFVERALEERCTQGAEFLKAR